MCYIAVFRLFLIISCGSGIISLAANVSPISETTTRNIVELYNQVLRSNLDKIQEALQQLNNTRDFIDVEYFRDLKSSEGTEGYYGAAYFVFTLVHAPLLEHEQPNQLLQMVLPGEKVAIREFFAKVQVELRKYLTVTLQTQEELLKNLTEWNTETNDRIVLTYLQFPNNLQTLMPELRVNNYELKI